MRQNYIERRFLDLEVLKKTLDNPDYILVKKIGHQLKGNAKSFNFDDLTGVAIAFEKAAESRDLSALLTAINNFEKYLNLYTQRLASEKTVSDK